MIAVSAATRSSHFVGDKIFVGRLSITTPCIGSWPNLTSVTLAVTGRPSMYVGLKFSEISATMSPTLCCRRLGADEVTADEFGQYRSVMSDAYC